MATMRGDGSNSPYSPSSTTTLSRLSPTSGALEEEKTPSSELVPNTAALGWFQKIERLATPRLRRHPPACPGFPDYDTTADLLGGNGTWRQRQAQVEFDEKVKRQKKEEEARRQREMRARLRKLAERERERELARLERMRRLEEEERLRRLAEERERLRREEAERARLRKLQEERERLLRLPRTCHRCAGTGKCQYCAGEGVTWTMYLSERVALSNTTPAHSQYGRRGRGCEACNGIGDGVCWGEFQPGTGRCAICQGTGNVDAPPGGWPDIAETDEDVTEVRNSAQELGRGDSRQLGQVVEQ